MEIRTYTPDDWSALRQFIHTHWRPDHPYTDATLYDWQFRGFGDCPRPVSKLAWHDGEIAGFLGGIPGEYFLNGRIVRGVVFDLWVVRKDCRDRGLGILLMRCLEQEFDATCCLGINLDVVRLYTTRGYFYCDRLHRYVSVLDARGYTSMVSPGHESDAWIVPTFDADDRAGIDPVRPLSPEALQGLYEDTVESVFAYGLHRSAAFWQWRYLESAGFNYLFWGHPASEGAIVGRVERIARSQDPALDGRPVLRLIELLPGRSGAWRGEIDTDFVELLRGVLAWASSQGCVLADYQISSGRLARVLRKAEFQDVNGSSSGILRHTPNLFQPLRMNAAPINFVWRFGDRLAQVEHPDANDVYFVKSDDGMDRPNLWPLPAEYSWHAKPGIRGAQVSAA